MSCTLFVCPAHDDVTAYLFFFCKQLVKESEDRGFKTIFKQKEDSKKEIVASVINKGNPAFVMFNGHGSPTLVCGHNDEILILLGQNEGLLKGRITYSLSCSSASGLGKEVGDENTTFIGYTEEFAVGMDTKSQAAVKHDQRAKLFLEPSNFLVQSLLKGNSVAEAVEKAKDAMKKNISLLKTDSSPDAKDYLPYLFNNYLSLCAFGNKGKRIEQNNS